MADPPILETAERELLHLNFERHYINPVAFWRSTQ